MDWVAVLEEKTKQLIDLWNRRKNEKDWTMKHRNEQPTPESRAYV